MKAGGQSVSGIPKENGKTNNKTKKAKHFLKVWAWKLTWVCGGYNGGKSCLANR